VETSTPQPPISRAESRVTNISQNDYINSHIHSSSRADTTSRGVRLAQEKAKGVQITYVF